MIAGYSFSFRREPIKVESSQQPISVSFCDRRRSDPFRPLDASVGLP